MEFELDPEQPAAVATAVGELLRAGTPHVDPWWQAGLAEALASSASDGDDDAR